MGTENFDDGKTAAIELQTLIIRLLDEGLDPRSVGLAACSVGVAMMIRHYGQQSGQELCIGLLREAAEGKMPLYPALNTSNRNRPKRLTE